MEYFRIEKTLAKELPTNKSAGYLWLTQDDGRVYVDISEVERICLSNVPTQLAQLLQDERHKTITAEELQKLAAIDPGAEANVQSDWEESDSTSDAYIQNKPQFGTAAMKDVAESGNATATQVVMGNDTRLTDSRPASDVYAWAKESTKPTYTASEVGAIPLTAKGAASGVAELDSGGRVPSSQLPSYVDDIIEGYYYNNAFYEDNGYQVEITPESGKIYLDLVSNNVYRWGGSTYIEVSSPLTIGTTADTAAAGNHTHPTSIASDSGTTDLAMQADTKYKITAGGNSFVFTTPPGDVYESKTAVEGGTDVSLVTTGEKFLWNNAQAESTIDGITGSTINRFGICNTAASTAQKEVTITDGDFSLESGTRVSVKFAYANTADNPTLKVETTAAKNIYHNGSQITIDDGKNLLSGICDFVYDGTQWHLVGNSYDYINIALDGDILDIERCGHPESGTNIFDIIASKANAITLTQAEYDLIQNPDPDTIYLVTDGRPLALASDVFYDNDDSGLTSITAQGAIDELAVVKSILGDFGTIEASTTASKNYLIGEFIIMGNYLYKVTDDITQGDTLTVGTNIILTTVADEMINRVLDFKDVTTLVSATQGTILTLNDPRITSNHIVVNGNVKFGNPNYISGTLSWQTTDGQLTISGICTTATTASFTLMKKDN